MQKITSIENEKIVFAAKLKDKKFRDEYDCYLVEGKKMVDEAVSTCQLVKMIFVLSEDMGAYNDDITYCVTEKIIKKISDTVTPQGIVAVVEKRKCEISEFNRCVILDGISDSGNLGTILRSCAACGIETVFVCDGADPYSPKAVRSSMSGIFYTNIFVWDRKRVVQLIKDREIPLLTADIAGENVFEQNIENFAIVVGSESQGVSQIFSSNADKTITLKMQNIESLNAGVALSVILYVLTN